MPQPFVPAINFHALNLRDLLDAREAYHVHLSHLDNVLATAVGLYRIRTSETQASGTDAAAKLKPSWSPGATCRADAGPSAVASVSVRTRSTTAETNSRSTALCFPFVTIVCSCSRFLSA